MNKKLQEQLKAFSKQLEGTLSKIHPKKRGEHIAQEYSSSDITDGKLKRANKKFKNYPREIVSLKKVVETNNQYEL